jgi:hypothetical protein
MLFKRRNMKRSILSIAAFAVIGSCSLQSSPIANHFVIIATTNDPLMIKAFGKNNAFPARKISSAKQIYWEDFPTSEYGAHNESNTTLESDAFQDELASELGKGLGVYYVIEAPQKDRVCLMYDSAGKKWIYYKLSIKKPLEHLTYKDDVDYSKNSNNPKQTVKRSSGATDKDPLVVKVVNNNISIELVKFSKFKELKISTRTTQDGKLLNVSFPAGFKNAPLD